MIETLAGGLVGGLFRLAPEVIKAIDRKNERSHELALEDKQLERVKVQGAERVAAATADYDKTALEGLSKVLTAIETPSGVPWVDAIQKFTRPFITLAFTGLYIGIKVAAFMDGATLAECWTPSDEALFAGIVNFWFMGRVFERK